MTPPDVAAAICKRDGFELVGLEGSGAFKHTFHVRRKDDGSFALKLYQNTSMPERSAREIEAMKKCDHPNIAKFIKLDVITIGADSFIYLVEEYLPGRSLSTRVGRLAPRDVMKLSLTLAQALDHIGAQKLVHRDLKPDNIMFRDDSLDHPVIVDFGLVRDLSADSLTATHALPGPGTPKYAAPEQLNNEKGMIEPRTDQFGLATTLSFALFGVHPYARSGDSLLAAIQRVANWENPSPTFAASCSAVHLDPLVRMVRPYPVDRFRTGRDLISAWQSTVKEYGK